MLSTNPPRPSFAPRNWGGWLAVAILWTLGRLPQRLGLLLVAPLGPLLFRFAGRRRAIAERNLKRCFPEWSGERKKEVLRESFNSLARMITEVAWSWSGLTGRISKIGKLHGLGNLSKAQEQGNGVLLVTGHSTCLEIGACIFGYQTSVGGVYRPLRNPVVEWYQNRSRARYTEFMINKRNAITVVKKLRRGATVWYAPDQDFGLKQSAFIPFFGIQTATLLATHRLPLMTGCAVVPMYPIYDKRTRKYDVYLLPALENYPSEDPVADLTRINSMIEEHIRKAPEQYWWIHRRFKTRPEGEKPFYEG